MDQRKTIKDNLDQRFSELYKTKEIDEITFFISKKGIPFHTCTMAQNMIVIEYADTWEDGNVFYTDEMSEEEIFNAMIKEIEE